MYMMMNIFLSCCCTFQVERFILILNQTPREPYFPGRIKIDRCADGWGGGTVGAAGQGQPAGLGRHQADVSLGQGYEFWAHAWAG